MTVMSTTIRAVHLVTNAAWFGGSLMGAVALNPAAASAGSRTDNARVADRGWNRWGPVQAGAIGLHLLSGVAIIADNRNRVAAHVPTQLAVVAKTVTTAAALASSAAAWQQGERLGDAVAAGDKASEHRARAQVRWLQWATPAATGALLVLDACLGEQQRGTAGLLDRPLRSS